MSAALFIALTSLYFGHGFFDDSFISLRYVKNLVDGHGLAWNAGEEPIEGFTSLGWLLLLAAFGVSSDEGLERLAIRAGIATGLAVILVSWLAARALLPRSRHGVAVIAALHLGLSGLLARHAISGMETMLAALGPMLVASLWSFPSLARHRRYWAALAGLVLLAMLARPDAAVFCFAGTAVLFVSVRREHRDIDRAVVCGAAVFALGLGALLAWKLWYFGSIIPLPAHMKLSIFRILPHWKFVFGHWVGFVTRAAPLLVVLFLGFTIARVPFRPVAPLLTGIAAHALYLLTVLPVMSVDYRFWIPIYPPLVVAAVYVVAHCLSGVAHDRTGRPPIPRLAPIGLALLLVFMDVGSFNGLKVSSERIYQEIEPYGIIGRAVAGIPGISTAVSEVGEFPYYSGCRVLDLSGLNDAFIARRRFRDPRFHDAFREYLTERWGLPDLYFEPPGEYFYAMLIRQPELMAKYDEHHVLDLTVYVLRTSPQRERLAATLRALQ